MARAIGVTELLNKKYVTYEFDGVWKDSFGLPAKNFKCIIWGQSGNGKTDFTIKICKYCTRFGKVLYNSIEEGDARTMQIAYERNSMHEVDGLIHILDKEPIPQLILRLKKRKSAPIVVIDSIQMSRMTREQYDELVKVCKKKALIFISHADGKDPNGSLAKEVRYDADIKINVEGYRCSVISRYGGQKPFIIWEEGAEKYWGASLHLAPGASKKKPANHSQLKMGI